MRNGSFVLALLTLLAVLGSSGSFSAPVSLTEKAKQLHFSSLVVDGHNDLPWALRKEDDLALTKTDLRKPQKDLHTDIERLRKGGLGAQFWSAYVPSKYAKDKKALRVALEQIDLIHRIVKKYPDVFEMAYTANDIRTIRKKGKIASLIGVEGGHCIANSLGVLRKLYDLGVRYLTLTHSDTTDWADSATDKPKHKGLSKFGKEVIREMNRLGMLVDISHVSVDTMNDVLDVSKAPIIASHSSAFHLANHDRNIPDPILKRLKKNGGVVMVNFYSGFVVPESAAMMKDLFENYRKLRKQYPNPKKYQAAVKKWKKENPIPRGSLQVVVDHIDHIVKVAGIDHVGLGSDYDGVGTLPTQLEDVSTYPYLTQELLNRGYSNKDIRKILGENALRVLEQAESVSQALNSAG